MNLYKIGFLIFGILLIILVLPFYLTGMAAELIITPFKEGRKDMAGFLSFVIDFLTSRMRKKIKK